MQIRQIIILIIIIPGLLITGCKRYKIPRSYPKPDKMAEILADIHLAENTVTHASPQFSTEQTRNIPGQYKYVLAKHNLTQAQFDTIRKWYVKHPQLYQKVYGMVLTRLNEYEADIRIQIERQKQEEQELIKLREKLEQERNIWKDTTTIKLNPEDSLSKNCPFRFITDTLNLSGTLKLSAFYRFFKEDASHSPQIMLAALYNDETADTVFTKIPHSFHSTRAELELQLKEDLSPIEVYGYLLSQDSLLNISVEIFHIKLLYYPPGDTLFKKLSTEKQLSVDGIIHQ